MESMEYKKKKSNKALIIGVVILSVMFFVVLWGTVLSGLVRGLASTELSRVGGDSIDVIHVEGTIGEAGSLFSEPTYNHKWTLNQIDNLIYSPSNEALVLYINSPGGGVYESDELYLKLKEYKQMTERPVYAYMAQTAASGGYYISLAADKIYANRMTMTGSIGVIMSTVDTTGLEEKIGLKTENIVSGRNKAMGNPLTEEQRQILQGMVDETYDIFVGLIAENRKIPLEETKKIADGRVYTATQAKGLKLIDEIGNFDQTISALREAYGLEYAEVYHVINETSFFDNLFRRISKNTTLLNEFGIFQKYREQSKNATLMYY